MNWTLSVIIICVVLAFIFSWQEFARPDRRRLPWRLLAIWLALATLACIALPVSYNGQVPIAEQSDAILLTEGFNKDSIPNNAQVFKTDKVVQKGYTKATLIGSTQELANRKPALKKVKILGYGLTEDELQSLNNLQVSYNAPVIPAGIQSSSWQTNLKTGEALTIQGTFKNNEAKTIKLVLKGLNTPLDSVMLPANITTGFQLSTLPKPSGRVVYQLLVLSGADTLSSESIPVQIEQAKPVKVLMLNTSPDFETRFLKNWLGENGYAVAARAIISKDKVSEEYVNIDKLNLQRLSAGTLDKFDVVVGSLSALKSLSPAEGAALRQQVTQKGLGVIIRADSSDKAASWLQRDFPVNTVATKEQLSVPLILQNQKSKTAKLSIDPSYISYRNNTQSLITDVQNHELAGITLAGAGKLILTTLNHTYTWLLNGNKQDYASLWTLLINKSARKLLPVQSWQISSGLPAVNEPVDIVLQSAVAPSNINVNSENTAVVQNATVPYEWKSTCFPIKQGWQVANVNNSQPYWWFNYTKPQWKSLKQLQKISATNVFVKKKAQTPSVTKQIQQTAKIQVPKTWFYLILLASCTFLWTERKFIN
jgi:primosomal replication protein N